MYRFEARIIGRSHSKSAAQTAAHNTGKRNSAVASAAYLSRASITDAKGQTWDYTHHFGGAGAKLLLPSEAPARMHDRAELWRAVERVENRKDSMLARDYILTMPYGLSDQEMWSCVEEFARRHFVSKGKPADIGLHIYGEPWRAWSKATKAKVEEWKEQGIPFYEQGKVPAHDRGPHILVIRGKQGQVKEYARYQPHMHVMTTFRAIDASRATGFAARKETVTKGHWAAEDRVQLLELRKSWASTLNRHLKAAGLPERVDHRSLRDRGIDREPMPKKGPIASKMERDGRGDEAHAVQDIERITERNRLVETIKRLDAEIHDLTVIRLKRQAAGDDPMEFNNQQSVEIENDEKRRLGHLARERERFEAFFKEHEDRRRRFAMQQDQREEERRTTHPTSDIASARNRWERAIGGSYDFRRPEESLALAVGIEAAQFRKEQDALRARERNEKDPEQRKLLELRRHIEACDYMAQAHERMAAISGVIIGRRDNEVSNRDRERASEWKRLGQGLRAERAELQQERRERRHAALLGETRDPAGKARSPRPNQERGAANREASDRDTAKGDRQAERTDRRQSTSEATRERFDRHKGATPPPDIDSSRSRGGRSR